VIHAALDDAVYVDDDLTLEPLPALFEALGRAPRSRFVHVGSAWVLAPGIGLDESAPLDPASPYARYKARQDAQLPELAERFDVPWINLRLFNVFGRFEKPSRLLPYLVSRLSAGGHADVSHGDQIRDFNDVDDAADAFRLALTAPDAACGATYHIGSGQPTSVREFVGHVTAVVGGQDRVRFGAGRTLDDELPALVADPSLAERVLGWNPAPPLEERVRRAANWWLARRDTESRQPEGSIR
jgi:polyisoprenyl-phosphate glycosyltransferase